MGERFKIPDKNLGFTKFEKFSLEICDVKDLGAHPDYFKVEFIENCFKIEKNFYLIIRVLNFMLELFKTFNKAQRLLSFMSLCERQDWFALAWSICRCRSFGYNYYEIDGLSHIIPLVGAREPANLVFDFIEDYIDEHLEPKAICGAKLTKSGPCSCGWLEPGSDCVAKYHVNALPDLYFPIDHLISACEKLMLYI